MSNANKSTVKSTELPASVREHIEHLERVRQDFIANVSHELRTPLTVIRGYLETLLIQSDQDNHRWQQIFQQMYQHSLRMERLIEDLLLLSKLEDINPNKERNTPVDMKKLLHALEEDARYISGEAHHRIEFIIQSNLQLLGVEEEIKSLCSNLLVNAIKYTPAGGHICVKWYKKGNQAYFFVSDTGIGIEAEHIPRLTERFYRVDEARSRGNGGTGLGLAIVKHVLLRLQGELKVTSEIGSGSTFTCIFPLNRTREAISS